MAKRPKKWIAKTGIKKHKGALHRALGIPVGQRIPDAMLISATHRPGHVGHMARMAANLRSLPHHYGPRKPRKLKHRKVRGR